MGKNKSIGIYNFKENNVFFLFNSFFNTNKGTMSSEIFEMFYAKVRANQYLEYILNIVHFKDNYLPVLFIKNDKVTLLNDISYYYGKEGIPFINKAIFKDIVHNQRTYLYSIDKNANYVFTPLIDEQKNIQPILTAFQKKEYKNVEAQIDINEKDMDND